MKKRRFLQGSLSLIAMPTPTFATSGRSAPQPTLLTVSGHLTRANRGPLDPALDQLLVKHGVRFEAAHAFTYADLLALPAIDIHPILEYDARRHHLRGPLLERVLDAAGAPTGTGGPRATVTLRALDGYTVPLERTELARRHMIVATHLDGAPLPLGGLGPLWAVADPAHVPELAGRPLPERFAQCPWGLYSIEIGAADR